jgi:hypothetical protein
MYIRDRAEQLFNEASGQKTSAWGYSMMFSLEYPLCSKILRNLRNASI